MDGESERDNYIPKDLFPSQKYSGTEADQSQEETPLQGELAKSRKKKKTDLEILTSPKGGLHTKYLWKSLEKPQIDERFKERKKEKKA